MAQISPAELDRLMDVDQRSRAAWVAFDRQHGDGLGIARYVRDPANSASAEIAVAVVDDWQHRGIARLLLEELALGALGQGIHELVAFVQRDNGAMSMLLARMAADARPGMQWTVRLDGP